MTSKKNLHQKGQGHGPAATADIIIELLNKNKEQRHLFESTRRANGPARKTTRYKGKTPTLPLWTKAPRARQKQRGIQRLKKQELTSTKRTPACYFQQGITITLPYESKVTSKKNLHQKGQGHGPAATADIGTTSTRKEDQRKYSSSLPYGRQDNFGQVQRGTTKNKVE